MPELKKRIVVLSGQSIRERLFTTEQRAVQNYRKNGQALKFLTQQDMAACDPLYFNGISAEIFNQVRQELVNNGFVLTGSSGTVHGPYGIVIRYDWNESTRVLEIEILEKSFFITCNQIKTQLYKAFNKYAPSSSDS